MSYGRQLLLLACMLPLAACNEVRPAAPEVKAVRTLVVDPRPIDEDHLADGAVIVVDRSGIDDERAHRFYFRRSRSDLVACGQRQHAEIGRAHV